MKTEMADVTNAVDISEVELVLGLKRNFLSYVRLERKCVRLVYEGKKRYLAVANSKVAEVFESGYIIVVRFKAIDSLANIPNLY